MSNHYPGEYWQEIRGEHFTAHCTSNDPETELAVFGGNRAEVEQMENRTAHYTDWSPS